MIRAGLMFGTPAPHPTRAGLFTTGARPEQVIAHGESQSGIALHEYIDTGAAEAAGLADGFVFDSGGAAAFPNHEPTVPVLQFFSEEWAQSPLTGAGPDSPRSTSPNVRTWWIAGATHVSNFGQNFVNQRDTAYMTDDRDARWDPIAEGSYGEQGGTALPLCTFPNLYPPPPITGSPARDR